MNDIKIIENSSIDINIIKIIKFYLENKLKLLIIIIFSFLLGIAYLENRKNNFTVSLNFSQINEYESYSNYDGINNLKFIEINPELLAKRFSTMLNRNNINQALSITKSIYSENGVEISDEIEKFQILNPVLTAEDEKIFNKSRSPYYTLIYETNNIDKADDFKIIISNLMETLNEEVRISYQKEIAAILSKEKFNKNRKLKELDMALSNIVDDFKKNIKRKIIYLNTQLVIAKNLDLNNNLFGNMQKSSSNSNNSSATGNNYGLSYNMSKVPYYFHGTKALKQEIIDLESAVTNINRENASLFIEETIEIEQQIRAFKQDTALDEFIARFETSILNSNDNNFSAVKYKISQIKITNNHLSYLITLGIFMFFGFLISTAVILLQSLNKYKDLET